MRRLVSILSAVVGVWGLSGCTCAKPIYPSLDGAIDAASTDAGVDGSTVGPDGGCTERYLECGGAAADCETYAWADRANCGECNNDCTDRQCVAAACTTPSVSEVGLGGDSACALLTSGHVLCWGRDHTGQLGDGQTAEDADPGRPDPVAVINLTDAVGLSVGTSMSCAIRDNGEVVCWGNNRPARFGTAEDSPIWSSTPLPLLGTDNEILQVSIGGQHVCARTTNDVFCGGNNNQRQLGHPGGTLQHIMAAVRGLPDRLPVSIAAGGHTAGFTVVAMSDGLVYAFGDNSEGQCGQTPGGTVDTPTVVPGLSNIVQVDAGDLFACALDGDGQLFCWGSNDSGETGNGTVGGGVQAPLEVVGDHTFSSFTIGRDTVFALGEAGNEVFAWGAAGDGQLGLGSSMVDDSGRPRSLFSMDGSTFQVGAGVGVSCYIQQRGGFDGLFCAGRNMYGQLGVSTPSIQYAHEPVPFFE